MGSEFTMQQTTDIRSLMGHSLRENALPVGLVALYLFVVWVFASQFGFSFRMAPWFNLGLFAACYMLIFAAPFLWMLAKKRPDSPVAFLVELSRRWRIKERAILAAPVLIATAVFIPVFSSVKSAIPVMNSYRLDPLFAQLDVWIHGRHVWEILHPVLGYPAVSFGLNGFYHLWVGAFYVVFSAVAIWLGQPELRRQFLTAFLLCWALLGNVGATLLASVGPCFYGIFYADDPYAGLMSYLQEADKVLPLSSLDVQAALIAWWQEGTPGLGRGISAMPSMHVSITCLLMLLAWNFGRIAGWIATLFLVIICLGAVHLGYHYAIDIYASLIGTPLIWWASKRLANLRLLPSPKLAESVA